MWHRRVSHSKLICVCRICAENVRSHGTIGLGVREFEHIILMDLLTGMMCCSFCCSWDFSHLACSSRLSFSSAVTSVCPLCASVTSPRERTHSASAAAETDFGFDDSDLGMDLDGDSGRKVLSPPPPREIDNQLWVEKYTPRSYLDLLSDDVSSVSLGNASQLSNIFAPDTHCWMHTFVLCSDLC